MPPFLTKLAGGPGPDLLIYVACLVVPLLLLVHARQLVARDRRLFGLFALFAVACGLTHSLMMLADELPNPAAAGAVKLLAAGVACAAALVALRFLPRAFAAVEEEIHEAEIERYRLLEAAVAAAGDGVLITGPSDGPGLKIVFANPAFERMTGYSTDEAVGLSPSILCGESTEAEVKALTTIRQAMRGTESSQFEVPGRRKDGTRLWAEWKVVPVAARGGDVTHWIAVLRDTTERRNREEFLRAVIANIPCGVFWKDADSVLRGCNDRMARDHGLDYPEQVIGRRDADLPGVTPAEAAKYVADDRRVLVGGEPVLDIEESHTRPDGTAGTLLASKVPLRDADGRVVGVLGVYQDITDRQRMARQLREAEKLEAVGRLARGIAHDFNNLLTVVLGNTDFLLQGGASLSDEDRAGLLTDVRLAADRGAGLVRQLLMYSRRQPTHPEVVDLNDVLAGMGPLLGRWLGTRVAVRVAPSRGPARVKGDRSQLEQVLMNLAVNARDAMPDGGTLTVSTETGRDPRTGAAVSRLVVADTGTGMTDEVKARIFEPFFTTKDVGKGTGLGLATVRAVAEQMGGVVEVESAAGVGTTFRVTLPACAAAAGAAPRRDTDTPPPVGECLSVLLVEDEEQVRKYVRLTLESRGHAVTEAADGETGLRLLACGAFDLLVTDVSMPGVGGDEVARRARSACPDVGVVFISGGAPDSGQFAHIAGSVLLPKPFAPTDLLRAARRAVGARAAVTVGGERGA